MADNDHTASELVARATRMSMSRRQALARAAALGLSIPALSALNSGGASAAPQSAATRQLSSNASIDLSFYHDKAPDLFLYDQIELDATQARVKNYKNENWRINWADIAMTR